MEFFIHRIKSGRWANLNPLRLSEEIQNESPCNYDVIVVSLKTPPSMIIS